MGLFSGGNSKSKSKTTNISEDVQKSYADYSTLDEGSSQSKLIADLRDVSNVDLSILDGGAIKNSYDFAGDTLEKTLAVEQRALQSIDDSSQRETSTAMAALNKATTLDSGSLTTDKMLLYGAIIGGVAIVFYYLRKG